MDRLQMCRKQTNLKQLLYIVLDFPPGEQNVCEDGEVSVPLLVLISPL